MGGPEVANGGDIVLASLNSGVHLLGTWQIYLVKWATLKAVQSSYTGRYKGRANTTTCYIGYIDVGDGK
jgi:hypothetical protein